MYSIESTPSDISLKLASRIKNLRKHMNLSQQKLAERSGVSYGSLKRFENTGKISLESLLKLAHLLGRLDDFEKLFQPGEDLRTVEKLFTNK